MPPEFTDEDAMAETIFAWGWTVWADSPEHAACLPAGWTFDARDSHYLCGCGCPIFVLEQVAA